MKGRKFLFVLDGFERKLRWFQEQDKYKDITSIPDEARCLVKTADADTLRVLVGSTESRFLVTSRLMLRDLEHVAEASCVRHEELTGLPEDAVLDLWKASVPTDRTEATRLKEMFKRVDNHPLAIAVFARRVNDFGSYDQWLKQQPDNSALESTFNGDAEQRISLLVDYAIQGIDEDARFVLKNLYKEKRPTRFAELVPLVSNRLTEDKLRQALELLFQRRLVGRDAGHTLFEAHPIVRSYVWNRLMNNCDPKDAATIRRPDERDTVLETVESLIKEVTDLAEKRHYDQAWRQIKDTLLQRLNSRMVAGRPEVQRLLMTFMTASSTNVNGLSLPLLETRSDQAELMSKLANVLDEMNESEKASIANRWAAAIYLQLGDYRNFLDRQRAGTWSQLYSGFLPNAVEDLIRVVADGCRQTADVSILFPSLCWLGLVSAIAGQGDLLSNLLKTDGQSIMGRWFLQTMAEACVYLGQYDAAIKLIYTAHSQPDDQDKEDRGQLAWESITLGAALVDGKSDWAEAARHLDFALDIGELDRYAIIQDFALAYHARVAVRQGKEAGLYFTRLDSVSRGNYSIPTTVHFLARAEDKFNAAMRFGTVQDRRLRLLSQAQFFAQKARESAGGKGSYGYAQGVTQAVDLENRCRKELGLAPAASGTNASPDIYRLLIDRLQPFHNSLTGGGSCEVTPFQLLESGTKSKAIELSEMDKTIEMESEETRAWWKEQAERVGTETAIRVLVELQELNASVDRLKAEATALRVRDPAQHLEQIALQRLKVRTLAAPSAVPILCRSEAEVTAWASQLREQCEHLGVDDWDNCLHSRTLRGASRQVILTTEDARVFQADADRRMAIDTAPHVARAWWQAIKLEYDGNQDPVVSRLAEAIASEGLTLGDFARHLEYPNPCCIRLAFSRHRLDRALMKHPFVHDVSNWTTEQVKAELDSVRGRIGWADANKSARQLWHAWEVSNENDPVTVLRIAEELAYRKATISDYYTAHVDSNTDHAQAILHYLDYKRLKDHETNRKLLDKARQDGDHLRAKELQLLIDAENAKPAELFPTEFTDTRGWSDEEIRSQLERVKKENLDWENTTKTAREWWTAFEQENLVRFVLVLRLAEELRYRRATITEFFLAYVYSNTDSIQANLHYLDYSRLKKQASVERTAPKPSPADVDIDEFSFTLDDFFGLKESGDEDSEITSDGEGAG
jgi:hypothetical protein